MKMWWRGEEYYIEEMFVRASVQGKGIGSRLLDYVESELKKEMVQAITLAPNSDMPAREFYAKNGFHPVDDPVFMKKKL
jgi:aminoglycoside 6'-N-acetyltransferase I